MDDRSLQLGDRSGALAPGLLAGVHGLLDVSDELSRPRGVARVRPGRSTPRSRWPASTSPTEHAGGDRRRGALEGSGDPHHPRRIAARRPGHPLPRSGKHPFSGKIADRSPRLRGELQRRDGHRRRLPRRAGPDLARGGGAGALGGSGARGPSGAQARDTGAGGVGPCGSAEASPGGGDRGHDGAVLHGADDADGRGSGDRPRHRDRTRQERQGTVSSSALPSREIYPATITDCIPE